MKAVMRKVFAPILNHFESGEEEISYKKSHRTILLVVGVLFLVLSSLSAFAAVYAMQGAAAIPIIVFFAIGLVCFVIGFLGTDRAVAKIWGNK
ncbi:hypothetical protein KO505_00190 [Psychrosphaera sp. F3M07]|jgi:uncharacterized membrane protein|uniref:hypothetical protein n=1 Tax=Psychrosphaera sp. F3M07 TaxID=2841560 RepID=UPI001C09859E|nr:hypothetical protein [Psychrosphaera sp. F3M07]MBU2916374.1 hypothetical protein [Psychrosphaera sp. F3M07]